MSKSRLVYSTETGRVPDKPEPQQTPPKGDGFVRLSRQTKGRKGKGVTIVQGLELNTEELKALAKKLKKVCGTGGTVKDFTIEIQGDQRETLKPYLEQLGHRVKLAGG